MTYNEIKEAIFRLSEEEQKQLITDVVPEIWKKACTDDSCLMEMRKLVDEDTVKAYRRQNMNGI
ncbi:MAG: hypothetical protein V2I97_24875 [Desulfococcaceae bacterium]|jgi:hypothetical protein|nr:hypothetical protein [Desulfococcaceae bacterium]